MKNCLLIALIVIIINFASVCWGFSITEPKTGTKFKPGDKVVVEVKTETNKSLKGVWFYAIEMSESDLDLLPPYNFEFTVPPEYTGIVTIVANGKFQDNSHVESKVQINVELPSHIMVMGIKIDPARIFLYKMSPDSDPNDIRIAETDDISVSGLYSDGVKRWIASSADGTTYTSSNENIVKADKDGKVTAQGVGKAMITVRNGNYSATVDVVVKPYGQ